MNKIDDLMCDICVYIGYKSGEKPHATRSFEPTRLSFIVLGDTTNSINIKIYYNVINNSAIKFTG